MCTVRPISDIWLLIYKQNTFGCFWKKLKIWFFSKTSKTVFPTYCNHVVIFVQMKAKNKNTNKKIFQANFQNCLATLDEGGRKVELWNVGSRSLELTGCWATNYSYWVTMKLGPEKAQFIPDLNFIALSIVQVKHKPQCRGS